MSYAMDKLKRTRRKRRLKRKKFLFTSGITRINRKINPELSLQRRSVLIIDQMLQDIMERICEEAKVACQMSGRKTMRAQDLHRGFKLLFKGKTVLKHVCLGCQEVINSPGLSHGKSSAEWEWLEEMYESHPNMSRGRGEGESVNGQEEEFNDFPPLTDEHVRRVHQWILGGDFTTKLKQKFNLTITRHDIQTLNWEPLAWLNDEVINFYMELICERSRNDDNLPIVHAMNTFFLKVLLDEGYSKVRRWTRKTDMFAQDIVLVPVHLGIHWCMAIIHMKNETIKYYDSMGRPNNAALNALVDYLQKESLDKKQRVLDMAEWRTENVQNIPQQTNGSDCGVFSCMYAEFVSRNRPFVFSQRHMPYFRKRMIFEICTGEML